MDDGPPAGVSGGATHTYVYDGDGNLVKATVSGVTTAFIGNYCEYSAGAMRKHYYAGGTRIAVRVDSNPINWLLTDHLGSTAVTTNSSGTATAELRYKAYGTTRYAGGTQQTNYRFTGQRIEPALDLYFYNSRWYDPVVGRFIQPDSIVPEPGNPQSLNRYAYTLNNPLRYVDPTGHAFQQGTGGGGVDPLTIAQREAARRAAESFGIPYELVAATIAVEIIDDTDWKDPLLDFWLQEVPLRLHYSTSANNPLRQLTDAFLAGYEHYFGLAGGRGPGNGVANIHLLTAKETEAYFAANYSEERLLAPMPDHYSRSAILLGDQGNIHYAAAVLRRNADYRTGTQQNHVDALSVTDMQMIYGRFRCDCWDSWSDFHAATIVPKDSRGSLLPAYLQLYSLWE